MKPFIACACVSGEILAAIFVVLNESRRLCLPRWIGRPMSSKCHSSRRGERREPLLPLSSTRPD